ncbi:hypothetical protein B0H14DRAFT_2815908 [Mycena olivaceomarginata]|nr:hypothetical protein B0H14DRAFT_2815908 [Mycena olivaceomarginata]
MLYGSGLSFASLQPLAAVVRSTIGHRWLPEGQIVYALVMADADLAQGLQSCKEMQGGAAVDYAAGSATLKELEAALEASWRDVEEWGGEFPFERAMFSVLDFKL